MAPEPHGHPPMNVPTIDARAFGLPPVTLTTGADLMGAALQGCTPCQDRLSAELADMEEHYELGHLLGALYAALSEIAGPATPSVLACMDCWTQEALGYVHRAQLRGLTEVYLPSLTRSQRLTVIDQVLTNLTGLIAIKNAERVTLQPR